MLCEVKELLESMYEEIKMDEENADAIYGAYATRMADMFEAREVDVDTYFYPETDQYID